MDRFVTPVLLPVGAVAAIVFVVLNLSRVLLAGVGGAHGGEGEAAAEGGGHAALPVVLASLITIAILIFASVFAASKKMRMPSLAVFVSVSMLAIILAGWLSVGDATEKVEEVASVPCTDATSELVVNGFNTLKFDKTEYTTEAGCLKITFGGDTGHTLVFDGAQVFPKFPGLGEQSYEIGAGEYNIYCDVSGHRAAGMEAVLTVAEAAA
jgi:plastocyanin